VFPVPNGGGGDAELAGDIFLPQSKFQTTLAKMVAEGDGIFSEFWMCLKFEGNFDCVGRLGRL
jgi:hypothetical protein